jgi:MoxR-like ATPase
LAATKTKEDWVPNATYKERPKKRSTLIDKVFDYVENTQTRDPDGTITHPGRTVEFSGLHGIAKTSSIKAAARKRGYNPIVLNMPTIQIPDLYMALPKLVEHLGQKIKELELHLHSRLEHEAPWVLILDDFRRVQPQVQAALFELANEGTLVAFDLKHLGGVFLIDNPVGEGYQGVISGDIAFESRFASFPVTANDTPWREYLAEKYSHLDLTGINDLWAKLDATARRTFNPRVVDHVIGVIDVDLPAMWGIPIMPSGRQKILDAAGNDVTVELLRKACASLGKQYRENIPNPIKAAAHAAIPRRWGVHMVGPHGTAKTASVRALGDDLDLDIDIRLFSAANMTMGDMVAALPVNGKLEFILNKRLQGNGKPYLLVWDEMFRAEKSVKPQLLEVFQELSIGSEDLPEECRGAWAVNNPAKFGSMQYRVGQADEALCSRFEISIEVTAEDTDWRSFLENKFGVEFTKPFIQWRQSLDQTGKEFIPPRTLDVMMELHRSGLDVDYGLPMIGNERIPVKTVKLKAALAGKKLLSVESIVQESQGILDTLRSSTDAKEVSELSFAVVRALQNAELVDLQPHEDLLVDLVKALEPDRRTALVNAAMQEKNGEDKLLFWSQVYAKTL